MEKPTRKYVESIVIQTVREVSRGVPEDRIVLGASYAQDLGLDSMDTVEIAGELEGMFGYYGFEGFPDSTVSSLNTLRKTADYILERIEGA